MIFTLNRRISERRNEISVWTAASLHPPRSQLRLCETLCVWTPVIHYLLKWKSWQTHGGKAFFKLFPSSLAESWISWISKMDAALLSTVAAALFTNEECGGFLTMKPKLDDSLSTPKSQINPQRYTQSNMRPMLYFWRVRCVCVCEW